MELTNNRQLFGSRNFISKPIDNRTMNNGPSSCMDQHPDNAGHSFYCTLARGHKGRHLAHGNKINGKHINLASWE